MMKTMRFSLSLAIILLTIASCKEKEKNHVPMVSVENTRLVSQVEFDETFRDVSLVPLETRQGCIVANVKKVKECEGSIYVLSESLDGQTDLYRFGEDGRFLNRIGEMGNAKNEYSRINTFYLSGGMVYIVDSNRCNLLGYTAEGKCIGTTELGPTLQFVREAVATEDVGKVLLSYGINFSEEHPLYRLVDMCTGDILWEMGTRYEARGNIPHSMHAVTKHGAQVLLTQPMDKGIYSLDASGQQLDKEYEVRCHGKLTEPSTDDYQEALREQGDAKPICGIYATEKLLVVNFTTGSVVWDMEEDEGIRIDIGVDFSECKVVPCIPLKIVSSSDKCLVTCWTPEELEDCLGKMGSAGVDFESGGNPILVRHNIR